MEIAHEKYVANKEKLLLFLLRTWQDISHTSLHWKLHIVTATLQNYKFGENLWEIYVSLLTVYVTLQQLQKV